MQRKTRSSAAISATPAASLSPPSPRRPQLEEERISDVNQTAQRPLPDIEISLKPQQNVPAFLNKLYNMVNDRHSNTMITWSDDGTSFLVLDTEGFSRDCLPRFFKHNNFSSFVRQLNMYGFRKVPHVLQGGLLSNSEETWEFAHDCFVKDRPDLLPLVRRKGSGKSSAASAANSTSHSAPLNNRSIQYSGAGDGLNQFSTAGLLTTQPFEDFSIPLASGNPAAPLSTAPVIDVSGWHQGDLSAVLTELHNIRQTQQSITNELHALKHENQMLWHETIEQQRRHEEQTQTVEKILRFLASVFSKDKIKTIGETQILSPALNQLVKSISTPANPTNINKGLSGSPVASVSGVNRFSDAPLLAANKKRKLLLEGGAAGSTASSSMQILPLTQAQISEIPPADELFSSHSIPPQPPQHPLLHSTTSATAPSLARIRTPSPLIEDPKHNLEDSINRLQGNIDTLTSSLGLGNSDLSQLDQVDVDDFLTKYFSVDDGANNRYDPIPSIESPPSALDENDSDGGILPE